MGVPGAVKDGSLHKSGSEERKPHQWCFPALVKGLSLGAEARQELQT